MPLLETQRSLARDGGWKVITNASASPLTWSYRHFGVNLSTPQTFSLPHVQKVVGVPMIARGHQVHVHNVGAANVTVSVPNPGGFFSSHVITPGKTCGFTLVGYDGATRHGFWIMHRTDLDHVTVGAGAVYPDGFRAEIAIDGMVNHYNLLQQVVAAGYDGTVGALVIARMAPEVIIGGQSNILPSFDTGGDTAVNGVNWHVDSKLFLRIPSTAGIHGAPGDGGTGGTGGTGNTGAAGTDGGIALRAAFSITIDNMGRVVGGCGGGGGGSNSLTIVGVNGGGGGGGAGANIWRGGVARGGRGGTAGGSGAQAGQFGTVTSGGAYGVGGSGGGSTGGRGGNGGSYTGSWAPSAGSPGRTVNDAGNNGNAGGAVGAAVSRKSTATVSYTPWSTGFVGGATIVVG